MRLLVLAMVALSIMAAGFPIGSSLVEEDRPDAPSRAVSTVHANTEPSASSLERGHGSVAQQATTGMEERLTLPGGYFTRNDGQVANEDVLFYLDSPGIDVGFARGAVILKLQEPRIHDDTELALSRPPRDPSTPPNSGNSPVRAAVVRLSFEGANEIDPEGRGELPHRSNFFLGNDPEQWRRGVPNYEEIVYKNLYDGIDLVYRMAEGGLKYDFVLHPGSDPDKIVAAYSGVEGVTVLPDGGIELRTSVGSLSDGRPVGIQDGAEVPCAFVVRAEASVGFACGDRDPTRAWSIDPLLFATYLGGSSWESWPAVGVDENGNVYAAGETDSVDFPNTTGAYDTSPNGGDDTYVVKFNVNGSALEYATYLGGTRLDLGWDIAVTPSGEAVVSGFTLSGDFPVTAGAYQTTCNNCVGIVSDAFVAKLNATGDGLVFSTYIGGSNDDYVFVTTDSEGNVFLAGYPYSADFPTTPGAYDRTFNGGNDAIVAKLNSNGTTLEFSTYFGGRDDEWGFGVEVDGSGNVFVVGGVNGNGMPVTNGAYDGTYNGNVDAFVAKFNPSGSSLLYATYLGGAGDDEVWRGGSIDVDSAGVAYVVGYTNSANYPLSTDAFDSTIQGSEGFVTALLSDGSDLVFSTYLGGASGDSANDVAVDASGNVVITGSTSSVDFPNTTGTFYTTNISSGDAFLTVLDSSGTILVYGSFLGGNRSDSSYSVEVDSFGNAYIGGYTSSGDFPVTAGAYDTTYNNGSDAFIAKFDFADPVTHNITIETSPPGLPVLIGGSARITPFIMRCAEGSLRHFNVTTPQENGSTRYVFSNWSDGGAQAHLVACLDNVTIIASFLTEFQATVNTTPLEFQSSVDGQIASGSRAFWWADGSSHEVTVPSPQTSGPSRFVFDTWSDGGEQTHSITATGPLDLVAFFVISEYLVNVTTTPPGLALRIDLQQLATPQSFWWAVGSTHTFDAFGPQTATSDSRYVFAGWSDGGAAVHDVIVGGSVTLTASYTFEYLVTVTASPLDFKVVVDGQTVTPPQSYWWLKGSSHTLGVPTGVQDGPDGASRYDLASWSDGGSREHAIDVTGSRLFTAVFAPVEYWVVVQTDPPGLELVLDGKTYTAPTGFWWPAGANLSVGTPSPQTLGRTRSLFSYWQGGGVQNHTERIVAPVSLTAVFNTEHEVIFETSPVGLQMIVDGTVYTTPRSVWWPAGSTHSVGVRTPQSSAFDVRYAFTSWSDGGPIEHAFRVDTPLTLRATLRQQFRLSIISAFGDPTCDARDCWYDAGNTARVTVASPVDGPTSTRYVFVSWSGDALGTEALTDVVMDAPREITVNWKTQYYLTVESEFGEVSGAGWYDSGSTGTFSVSPTEIVINGKSYRFARWSGTTTSLTPTAEVTLTGPVTVVAQWEEVPPAAGTDLGLFLLVGGVAAVSAGALVAVRRQRARRTPTAMPQETTGSGMAPSAATVPPEEYGGQEIAPCPQCGAGVTTGAPQCSACGLSLIWE